VTRADIEIGVAKGLIHRDLLRFVGKGAAAGA
jgi:hypothetical protein